MIDSKTINVVNRIMQQYGYDESLEQTSLEMIDCLNLVDKNKGLLKLFDRYDRDELTKEEQKAIYKFKVKFDNIINHKNEITENNQIIGE